MKRRARWFAPSQVPTLAIWWIAAGTVPTLEEGVARLERLRRDGPTANAFGWDQLPA